MDSIRSYHGIPKDFQTLISWSYGYGASWIFSRPYLGYQNHNDGLVHWRFFYEASWVFQRPCLRGVPHWNPNQEWYGPSVLCDLTFHLLSRKTLISWSWIQETSYWHALGHLNPNMALFSLEGLLTLVISVVFLAHLLILVVALGFDSINWCLSPLVLEQVLGLTNFIYFHSFIW